MPLVLKFMFCSFPKGPFAGEKILVRRGDAEFQADARRPAKLAKAAHVEQFPRRSVRFGGVELQGAPKSDDRRHRPRELRYGLVLAAADIDQRKPVGALQEGAERIVRQ